MTQAMHQVLVIEDEPEIRNVVRVLLETEHYRVVEAENAARGEIEARAHKPDLLLVDLGLPDGDGIALIRRVRTWSPVPVIVLSARTVAMCAVSRVRPQFSWGRPTSILRDVKPTKPVPKCTSRRWNIACSKVSPATPA